MLASLTFDDLDDLPLQRLDAVVERHQHSGHYKQRQHHDDRARLVPTKALEDVLKNNHGN